MKSHFFVVSCVVLLLAACSSGGNYAPIVDRDQRRADAGTTHEVRKGETLYSIAWRYNLEFRELAITNGIKSPYTIFPGQKLLLGKIPKVTSNRKVSPPAIVQKPTKKPSKNSTQVRVKNPPPPKSSSHKPSIKTDNRRYPFRWQWPSKAPVSQVFSATGPVHKGIDLQGKLGEPVVAANSGKVVYAGSGLVGYGKLIIVKHSELYLSAYAHNNRLIVSEGQMVQVGQKIAEMGDSGTDSVKLHFEIRKNGKPVNPLRLLPRK